tara:strand:- start:4756 stop:5418 length:663 start_codon:yes stop_codon:yes gene_type:complete
MTPKQWHRYWIRETALFIGEHTDSGAFVEAGVKQGTSTVISMQALEGERGVLFDTWRGFVHYSKQDILNPNREKRLKKRIGTGKNTYEDCRRSLKKNGLIDKCEMFRGDILETVPKFVSENSDIKIQFMHADTDLYMPTKVSLDCFSPFIIDKGAIFCHDFYDPKWQIHIAVEEFLEVSTGWQLFAFDPKIVKSLGLHACVLFKGDEEYLNEFSDFVDAK